uniref:Uncharacterized protein n=1 Tax=uncultured marine virus TaxID=186617 RepID=A0A0F7L9H5_9VIRU|nr:hypothetical protein [uncultured marine virus]
MPVTRAPSTDASGRAQERQSRLTRLDVRQNVGLGAITPGPLKESAQGLRVTGSHMAEGGTLTHAHDVRGRLVHVCSFSMPNASSISHSRRERRAIAAPSAGVFMPSFSRATMTQARSAYCSRRSLERLRSSSVMTHGIRRPRRDARLTGRAVAHARCHPFAR